MRGKTYLGVVSLLICKIGFLSPAAVRYAFFENGDFFHSALFCLDNVHSPVYIAVTKFCSLFNIHDWPVSLYLSLHLCHRSSFNPNNGRYFKKFLSLSNIHLKINLFAKKIYRGCTVPYTQRIPGYSPSPPWKDSLLCPSF